MDAPTSPKYLDELKFQRQLKPLEKTRSLVTINSMLPNTSGVNSIHQGASNYYQRSQNPSPYFPRMYNTPLLCRRRLLSDTSIVPSHQSNLSPVVLSNGNIKNKTIVVNTSTVVNNECKPSTNYYLSKAPSFKDSRPYFLQKLHCVSTEDEDDDTTEQEDDELFLEPLKTKVDNNNDLGNSFQNYNSQMGNNIDQNSSKSCMNTPEVGRKQQSRKQGVIEHSSSLTSLHFNHTKVQRQPTSTNFRWFGRRKNPTMRSLSVQDVPEHGSDEEEDSSGINSRDIFSKNPNKSTDGIKYPVHLTEKPVSAGLMRRSATVAFSKGRKLSALLGYSLPRR